MSAYFTIGCLVEINPLATWQYVRNGFTLDGYELGPSCRPDVLTAVEEINVGPFTTPELDRAWWWDPSRPELSGFGGWWVDSFVIERDVKREWRVTSGVRGSARPGRLADQGYVITVEGYLHGATCCAVATGWAAIQEMLSHQCDPCVGTTLVYPACVPTVGGAGQVPLYPFPDETSGPGAWRTLFGVALVEAPQIVDSSGPQCPSCNTAPLTRVRMVLRASPGRFTNPAELTTSELIPGGTPVVGYVAPVSSTTTVMTVEDPLNPQIAPPPRPVIVGSTTSVTQTFVAKSQTVFDTSNSLFFPTVGMLSVAAGATDLRNLRIVWFREEPDAPMSAYVEAGVYDGIAVPWIPAGYVLTIDGRVGTVGLMAPNGQLSVAPLGMLRSRLGGPWSGSIDLPPGRWVLQVEADPDHTGSDATLTLSTAIVEP